MKKHNQFIVEVPEKFLYHFVPLAFTEMHREYATYNDLLNNVIYALQTGDLKANQMKQEIEFLKMLRGNFKKVK